MNNKLIFDERGDGKLVLQPEPIFIESIFWSADAPKISDEKPKKALFWKQPYGTAMFCGKRYESRTWRTNFRGLILVCTSLKPYEFKRVLEVSGYEHTGG